MRVSATGIKSAHSRRRQRGVTLVELLVAALIVSIVAAGAVSSWSISSKIPATLRATEIASKVAVREIEQIKAKRYINLSLISTPTPVYYDKSGAARDTGGTGALYSAAQPNGYTATTTITVPTGITATGTTKDLLEVVVIVKGSSDGKTYETQRTLMTFGGF